jgi:branched-chain amino acid transport system substrate-binding protein
VRTRFLFLGLAALLLAACGNGTDETVDDADGEATVDDADDADDAAGPDDGATLDEPVRIGVVFSQTAGAAVYGEAQRAAAELAAEEINEAGDVQIELVIEDDASDPSQGITAYERLIQQENVSALIGPTLSNVFFSAGPLAQDAGIPALGVSTTADGITDIGDYIFRNALTERQVIPDTITAAIEEFDVERVAILHADDDAFTVSGYEIMLEAAEELGLEVVSDQSFATGDSDFSAQLTSARDQDPDALLVSALAEEGALLLTQAADLGLDVPVVGGNGFNSPAIIEQAGEDAEGVLVGAAWNGAADDPINQDFKAAYEERTGGQPDQFAAQAYAGVYLFAQAIEAAGSGEPDAIRDALAQIEGVETVLGSFSFTEDRDADHSGVTQIVRDGEFQILAD